MFVQRNDFSIRKKLTCQVSIRLIQVHTLATKFFQAAMCPKHYWYMVDEACAA